MPKKRPRMVILADDREKPGHVYDFKQIKTSKVTYVVERQRLLTGDYSLELGLLATPEEQIVIERKTLADLFQSVSWGRQRLESEFDRMTAFGYAAIVIEAPFTHILQPHKHLKHQTLVAPKSVISTLVAWSQRYSVHVYPCPCREFAEIFTFRLLERWFLDGLQKPDK